MVTEEVENVRLKKVVLWLISQGDVSSQKALASALSVNHTYFSQVVSGIKPMSDKFVQNLILIYPKVNPDYLFGLSNEISKNTQVPGVPAPKPHDFPVCMAGRFFESSGSLEVQNLRAVIANLEHRVEMLQNRVELLASENAVLRYRLEGGLLDQHGGREAI